MKRNKTLDWTAISVVALTLGGVALSMGTNWEFTLFFLIPLLLMVVTIGWVIGWASLRCWRLWNALDREQEGGSGLAKIVTIVAAILLIVSPPAAKAIDDNMAGAWQGIYTHMAPTFNIYWGNFLRQFQYAWHANDPHGSNYDGR